ncbi:hypothetical protein T265_09777 [Opisthorchis viverrini]|uniref:Uncharacterized protein n=1 Tax=Opisthorchis viverrini TaxID=6198 RepID=A0A075A3P8_OPIVI|nr:hypothetical protein T265_09777 [Opisthorchis viverrini]KER22024.1 hypothetical protein T265_09777 [Opisthorchis viverrini]
MAARHQKGATAERGHVRTFENQSKVVTVDWKGRRKELYCVAYAQIFLVKSVDEASLIIWNPHAKRKTGTQKLGCLEEDGNGDV